MEDSEEEADLLNEETFDCAEIGDWECEHEKFVLDSREQLPDAPSAEALPRLWEASDSLSFLWQTDELDPSLLLLDDGAERVVDVEETLQKLVSDETFEDPAILDISRKVSNQKIVEASLQHIRNAPAYPTVSTNIFDNSRDIWSTVNTSEIRHMNVSLPSGSNIVSSNILDVSSNLFRSVEPTQCLENSSTSNPLSKLMHELQNRPIPQKYTQNQDSGFKFLVDSRAQIQKPFDTSTLQPAKLPYEQSRGQVVNYQAVMTNLSKMSNIINLTNNQKFNPPIPNVPVRTPDLQALLTCNRMPPWNNSLLLPGPKFFQHIPPPHFSALHSLRSPCTVKLLGQDISRFPNSAQSRFSVQRPVSSEDKHVSTVGYPASHAQYSNVLHDKISKQQSDLQVLSLDKEVDPNSGSWMSDYETISVLLSQLRPLMVSNPYVQDYYFAVRWLNRVDAIRVKRIANGQLPSTCPPAVTHIPIPINFEILNDPNSEYHVCFKRKLVVPLSILHLTGNSDQVNAESSSQKSVDKSCDNLMLNQSTSPIETSNGLGRFRKHNVYRQHVVAEISLATAIASTSDQNVSPKSNKNQITNQQQPSECSSFSVLEFSNQSSSVKVCRRNRLLLAHIERMYTILLILDEVSVSLARVVVQNDVHARLTEYRQDLVLHLAMELFKLPGKPINDPFEMFYNDDDNVNSNNIMFSITTRLFTVPKGMRLWSTALRHFPKKFAAKCLGEFLRNFVDLQNLWPTTKDEAASLFYANLRDIVYQISNVSDFLKMYIPEVAEFDVEEITLSKNLESLLTCKLGISLIFCLLDACARASNPTDPSDFIRFGVLFCRANYLVNRTEPVYPIETFPHLASILVLYIKPTQHSILTAEQLAGFCELMEASNSSTSLSSKTTITKPSQIIVTSDLIQGPITNFQSQCIDKLNNFSAEINKTQINSSKSLNSCCPVVSNSDAVLSN